MNLPNLLIVSGRGTKSGKTSLACRIIEQFNNEGIIGIKITPHFHETTNGLIHIEEGPGFAIYEESELDSGKDTSRMLKAGAAKVYFAKVWDDNLGRVFKLIIDKIPSNRPVICESQALRSLVEPGLFIITTSDTINKHKDISHLEELPHVKFSLEGIAELEQIPIDFKNGRWLLLHPDI